MKAKEVMELLHISRNTLYRLRKEGVLNCTQLANGHYQYKENSVYEYLTKMFEKSRARKIVIYARVSTIGRSRGEE